MLCCWKSYQILLLENQPTVTCLMIFSKVASFSPRTITFMRSASFVRLITSTFLIWASTRGLKTPPQMSFALPPSVLLNWNNFQKSQMFLQLEREMKMNTTSTAIINHRSLWEVIGILGIFTWKTLKNYRGVSSLKHLFLYIQQRVAVHHSLFTQLVKVSVFYT